MKTILITGCSSGFGHETACYFLERGWKVIATMRTPNADLLPRSENLRIIALDIADSESIRQAVAAAGEIDALVNNAGIGLFAALEGVSLETVSDIFTTNTLGTIAMTQAVLPQFRTRRAGVIVNVTSTVTLTPLPLLSVYTASKAAVNAFTESLALELEQFNVRVRLVLPGRAPGTRFGANAQPRMAGTLHEAYAAMVESTFNAMLTDSGEVTESRQVAEAIWQVVNDPAAPMRTPAGSDALALAAALDKQR